MNYAFIKRYNPAYDFFLVKYFKEGGLDAGEKLPWKRADYKQLLLQEKSDVTPHEKLFLSYIRAWRQHPETRPSLHELFEKIPGGGGNEVKKLMQLQSELPSRLGKLLFSSKDVADDISNFYKRYLTEPLRKDIEKGARSRELSKYFVHKELDRGMKLRNEPDKMEVEDRKISEELLSMLKRITSKVVRNDLNQILANHFDAPEHMREGKYPSPYDHVKVRRCEHKSELLSLNVYHELKNDDVTGILAPIRGFGQIEEGWTDVLFPRYYVKQAE